MRHGTLTVQSAVGRSKIRPRLNTFPCGAGYGVLPVLNLIRFIGSLPFDLQPGSLFNSVSFAGIGREMDSSRARSGSI
jgi:hypothetical protein